VGWLDNSQLGSSHLTLSFDLSPQNPNPKPYPRESGSPSPSHTLALRNGKVYGPFTPDRDGIGNGNGNGNGNKIGDKSDRCVPQLSQMSGGAWYYRPDTDSDAYTDESTEATGATHPFPSTTGTGTPAPTTSTTGTHVWTKTSGIEAPSPPFPHYEYEYGRQVIRPTRPDTRVSLLSFLDRGRLWDTFRAELIYPGTSTGGCEGGNEVTVKSVIVKTTCPMLFPSEVSYGVEKERCTQTEARSAIFREDKAYRLAAASGSGSGSRSGAASGSGVRGRDGVRARARGRNRGELALALAGRVMPRYLGLWGGVLQVEGRWKAEREIWVMILEDCGMGVVLEELTGDDKYVHVSFSFSLSLSVSLSLSLSAFRLSSFVFRFHGERPSLIRDPSLTGTRYYHTMPTYTQSDWYTTIRLHDIGYVIQTAGFGSSTSILRSCSDMMLRIVNWWRRR